MLNPKDTKSIFAFDELANLSAEINTLSSKFKNRGRIAHKLALEEAEISPKEYFSKLRKRYMELIRHKQDLYNKQKTSSEEHAKQTKHSRVIMHAHNTDQANSMGKRSFELPPELTAVTSILEELSACKQKELKLAPSYTNILEESKSINHDSTAGVAVDDSHFDSDGVVMASAWLCDDAAFWRDDNPDFYSIIWEAHWHLPVQSCDCIAICKISTEQKVTFDNLADDAGHCFTLLEVKNTLPDGSFPEVRAPTTTDSIIFDSEESGVIKSGIRDYTIAFKINAGVQGKVAVGHFVHLLAQDGEAKASLLLHVGNRHLGHLGHSPHIATTIIPLP